MQLIFAPRPSGRPTYARYASRNVPERRWMRAAIQGPLVARSRIVITPVTVAGLQSHGARNRPRRFGEGYGCKVEADLAPRHDPPNRLFCSLPMTSRAVCFHNVRRIVLAKTRLGIGLLAEPFDTRNHCMLVRRRRATRRLRTRSGNRTIGRIRALPLPRGDNANSVA